MNVPWNSTHAEMKATVALLFTFTAGFIDIVGYITVYHVFVAHMTGATVHLGNKLVTRSWPDVARAASVVASFVGGSVIGRTVIEMGARRRVRTAATFVLAGEVLLVLAFLWLGSSVLKEFTPQAIPLSVACLLLALLAIAMGLQTAILTRIGPLTIHTTFVTGMLNKLAQEVARWLFWAHDSWRQRTSFRAFVRSSGQHTSFRNARFMAAIWFSYAVGSVAGTWTNSKWRLTSLYLPVFILLVSIAVDQLHPLSIEEEKDQS
ncbi:MAG: YoaK family protein [Candidatus Sulfotelmatobacter sp.]